jgi:carboxypeptidase family protein
VALMPPKLMVAVAAVLLALVAGAAYVGMHEDSTESAAAPAPRLDASSASPETSRRASLRAQRPDTDAAAATEPAAEPAKPATTGTERKCLLHGRLVGFEAAGDAATVTIAALSSDWRAPEPPAPLRIATSGEFDADVSALAAAPGVDDLRITVEHPRHLPATTRVSLARKPEEPDAAQRTVRAEIRMVRASRVAGRVVDAHGRPVEGALVGVFPAAGADAIVALEPVDRTTTDSDGAFVLRLRPGERHFVAAGAPSLLPAVAVTDGGESTLAPLVLREGAAVSGRATRNDAPLVGAKVSIYVDRDDTPKLHLGDLRISGLGASAAPETVAATTAADGSFLVVGLPPGACWLSLEKIDGEMAHSDVFAWTRRLVEAPATDVDLAIVTSRLVVEVRSAGQSLTGAQIEVRGSSPQDQNMSFCTASGTDGTRTLTVRADADYDVAVEPKGFAKTTRRVHTNEAGAETRERFDPDEASPGERLRIALAAEGGTLPKEANIALIPLGAEKTQATRRGPFEVRDGRIEATGVPVGRWRVVVRAGFSWQANDTTWLDAETEVEITPGTVAEAKVTLRPGGRLRIAARDADGRFVAAQCVIRDAAGRAVSAYLGVQLGRGTWIGHSSRLSAEGPATVDCALAPGTYTVDISLDGFAARVDEVRIGSGKWTDHEVTLTRR